MICKDKAVKLIAVDNQQDATILFYLLYSALHVSGDVFAHYQEHITVNTASGNVHRCCFWPAATSVDVTRSCSYSDMLLMMGENIARNM